MSDMAADYATRLNLAELVARIERQQEKTRKFVAEGHKIAAEASKLNAEAGKLRRDRFLAPVLAVVATLGAIAALAPQIIRTMAG